MPRERRAILVYEFGITVLSASKLAQLQGVNYNTFWNWLQEHRLTAWVGQKTHPTPRWVEVLDRKDASSQSPQAAVGPDAGSSLDRDLRSRLGDLAADLLNDFAQSSP